MNKLITFGEIMGRLNPHGYLRIVQANELELSFAGGEANVAVAVANFGVETAFVTKVPQNDLTTRVLRGLKGYGIDVSHVIYGGERLGMYYVEKGASQRPSKVIYDRKFSSIAMARREDFDWNTILDGCTWFHFTGITPALGGELPEICKDALLKCREKNIMVSCDLNYRKNLWTPSEANKVMNGLMPYVDVCLANEEDSEKVFGISADDTDLIGGEISKEGYKVVARKLMDRFGFKKVAITLRGSISASDNTWAGMLYDGEKYYMSHSYKIHLVDRVGGGDSFGGGLIYALMNDYPPQEAIEFAVAASCLKQTTEYDLSLSTVEDVKKLMDGDGSGRVQR